MTNEKPIVIVDDEMNAQLAMQTNLESFGFRAVRTCSSVSELWTLLEEATPRLILLDIVMPEITGEEALARLQTDFPDIPVIMITGVNELETAVRCMQKGARDYMVKPIERERLKVAVSNCIKMIELEECREALSHSLLTETVAHPEAFESIITVHSGMRAIFKYTEAVGPSSLAFLITGETGTGKELIARAIHEVSGRTGEYVSVNAAGVDDTMLADTLFGHERGAFTGAENARTGLVEKAAQGTLFLDEIGDLSPASQVKLLRLLQENEYQPLGSDRKKHSTARIVAATSKSMVELQNSKEFRRDLFYRLRTHHIQLPPLRDRKSDIPYLTDYFLKQAAEELNKPQPTPPKEIYQLLDTYHFPGNIRELRAIIFDAVANHQGRMLSLISIKNALGLRASEFSPLNENAGNESAVSFGEKLPTFKEMEALLLEEALERTKGNRSLAATILGVTRQAITMRLKKAAQSQG